jgi:ribonuclease Y
MPVLYLLLGVAVGLAIGAVVLYLFRRKQTEQIGLARAEADRIIHKVNAAAEQTRKEALSAAEQTRKEALLEAREMENRAHQYENETRQGRLELQKTEQRLVKKEESLDHRTDLMAAKEAESQKREQRLQTREKEVENLANDYERLRGKANETLEKVAGMSAVEAKQALVSELIAEAKLDAAKEFQAIEDEARDKAQEMAKKYICTALSRFAGEMVAEQVVSVINIPNEEMKGRIIGREGRNIRAFEAATGVDLIIDDTPEAVIVSGFSAVRREVARLSLEKLVSDGRIHPSRIEEIVKKAEAEVEAAVKQAGERATMELNVYGLHPELIKLIGRLRYRTSYGQNMLAHSIETAYMAGLLAAELGQNVKVARRAALLHDIGKAADQESEGPHHVVGANLAKKFGETQQIVNAIRAHHEEPQTLLDHIVMAADSVSGARPGARREVLETYLKRLEDLETISKSFKGVDDAYAFQAGREIRVLVRPEEVSDAEIAILAKDIAKKVEQELTYPGRVKVSVIRQTRAEAHAK